MASNISNNSRIAVLVILLVIYASFGCKASSGRLATAHAQAVFTETYAVDHEAVARATNAYENEAAAPEAATDAVNLHQDATTTLEANSYEGATIGESSEPTLQKSGEVMNAGQPQVDIVEQADTPATASSGLAAPKQQKPASNAESPPAVDGEAPNSNIHEGESVHQFESASQTKHKVIMHAAGQQQQQQHYNAAIPPKHSTSAVVQPVGYTEQSVQNPAHPQQQQSDSNAQVAVSATLEAADAAATNVYEGSVTVDPQQVDANKPSISERVALSPAIQQQAVVNTAAVETSGKTTSGDGEAPNLNEGEKVAAVLHGTAVKQDQQQDIGATHTALQHPQSVEPTGPVATATASQTQQLVQYQSTQQPQGSVTSSTVPPSAGAAEGGAPTTSYEGDPVADADAGAAVQTTPANAPSTALPSHQQQQEVKANEYASQPATASTTAVASPQQPTDAYTGVDTESVSNRPSGLGARPDQQQLAKSAEDQQPLIPARELQAVTPPTAAQKVSALNTYQADLAELEALASLFKPVYSVDDPTTHATLESAQQKPLTPPASTNSRSTKAAGTSIDDMTLGLGSNYPVPGSTKQQQGAPAATPVNPRAAQGSGNVSSGPNTPGNFVGGPTLTQQHAGWKSDNPEHQNAMEDGAGTYVAAGGITGAVNKDVFNSLDNDLSFFISSKQSPRRTERRLMSIHGQADVSDPANLDSPTITVPGPLQYPEGAFDLSAAAVQAAQVQVNELQQVLAAKRMSNVQLEQAIVPEYHSGILISRSGGKHPGTETDQQPSKLNPRKLMDTSGASAAKVKELTQAGRGEKPLWGVTYSWRRAEACDGARQMCRCPRPEELDTDLNLLYRYSHRIRTYSVECPELLRMLLHYTTANPAASWLIGVWIGADPAANQAQIKLLGRLLEEFPHASLAGIAVGNEAVSRGDVKEPELIEYIQQTRNLVRDTAQKTDSQSLAQVPIMTVEQPAALTPQLAAAIDAAGAVIQPFFSGAVDTAQSSWVKSAVGIALQQHTQLQEEIKGKQVLIAEIGWPSRSGEVDTNRASLTHAAEFASAWVKAADKVSIPYYYHELADAGWKATLRQSAALAAAAARTLKGTHQQPSILGQGVLGDEHFGLVTADRMTDKGLLPQHKT